MKKNRLKSKKINKTKSRNDLGNTSNQNEIYDILENNIITPYINSILEENNIPSEEINTTIPQDNTNEQNINLLNQNDTNTQNTNTMTPLNNNMGPSNDNTQYPDTTQNNIPNQNEYYLPEQGPGPVIPPNFPPQQCPIPIIPPGQKMPNVKIKSVYTDSFVVSDDKDTLYSAGADYNQGENFRIIPVSYIHVILRIVGEGYIRIDDKGILVADVNKNEATKFVIFRHGSAFAILAPNGKFVEVISRDNIMLARSIYASARSLFKFKQVYL